MKLTEITRAMELESAAGKKKPENSTLYKIVDLEKIYKSIGSSINAYFTVDENDYLTALVITTFNNELIRLENISKKKGLITIIILAILNYEHRLKIRPSEDLTQAGFQWLLHNIRINKYFSVTDYYDNPISIIDLENDWLNYGEKIGLILMPKKLLSEDFNKNMPENIGLLMPMIKWLGDEDLL